MLTRSESPASHITVQLMKRGLPFHASGEISTLFCWPFSHLKASCLLPGHCFLSFPCGIQEDNNGKFLFAEKAGRRSGERIELSCYWIWLDLYASYARKAGIKYEYL